MSDPKSFKPTDFSLRDIAGFVVIYLIISVVAVALGLLAEGLPDFWKGVLLGSGVTLIVALLIFRTQRREQND